MHATFAARRTGLAALALYALLAPGALRAALHGGIEIGGKGVKATVLETTGEGEDVVFKTIYSHTTNTAPRAAGRFPISAWHTLASSRTMATNSFQPAR